jgi:carbonic anhydrase/acetyltransferase-like protein (isoleucine patch superfamily)
MDIKKATLLARAYFFVARSIVAGKLINKLLEFAAWLDYRLLIILSCWHPDMDTRIKLLRKRGVRVGEHVWVDLGVWIEVTTPQAVVIEDYVKLAYGVVIYAHDAAVNTVADLPMRVQETRIGYNSAIGARTIIMPGGTIGRHSGCTPGSVVTSDVPDMTVVAGHPARKLFTDEELLLAWQAGVKAQPDLFYDHPNPSRAPSTPLDHLLEWRQYEKKVHDYTELRTGTLFDHILDAKAEKRKQ